jgi:hypothetical protein
MVAVAITLMKLGSRNRDLFLFDTFEGMSEPTSEDVTAVDRTPASILLKRNKRERSHIWAYAPLEDVKDNLQATGYPSERLHFIKGKVEDTVPIYAPDKIAILRLDTDWYESTKHELEQLYPRLASGGVLIVDDYGHWQGARKATDEYFSRPGIDAVLLNRIDTTGRIAIKH